MEKPVLACFATVEYVSDQSIFIKPDTQKKVIWGVPYNGASLLKNAYLDRDIPAYVGQYVGVVYDSNNEYHHELEIYDANSPVFLNKVADELARINEKERTSGVKAK